MATKEPKVKVFSEHDTYEAAVKRARTQAKNTDASVYVDWAEELPWAEHGAWLVWWPVYKPSSTEMSLYYAPQLFGERYFETLVEPPSVKGKSTKGKELRTLKNKLMR